MTKTVTLAGCALLVNLRISQWSPHKKDKSTEAEVRAEKMAASRRATSVRKNLFAECPQLDAITAYAAQTRQWLNGVTAPWDDNGTRIVPSVKYLDIQAEMHGRIDHFNKLVRLFIDAYDTAVSKQAFELGSLFNRGEYPPKEAIASKFSMRMEPSPVPTAGHFMADVVNTVNAELTEDFARQSDEKIEAAMRDVWGRLKDKVEHIKGRMDALIEFDPNAEPEIVEGEDGETKVQKPRRPKLHQSLLDTAMELCESMKHLNLMNDPALEQARIDLLNAVKHLDIDSLKKTPELQVSTRDKMNELLAKLPW